MSTSRLTTMAIGTVLLVTLTSCTQESDRTQQLATMQAAYEGRIAKMQLAYDELQALLDLSEARFQNELRTAKPARQRDGCACKEETPAHE
jgi:hypothetical protein